MYIKLEMLYNYKLNRPFLPGDEIEVRVVRGVEDSWIPYILDEVDIKANKLWLNLLSLERGVRQKLNDIEQSFISSDDLIDLGFERTTHWGEGELNYGWSIKHHYTKNITKDSYWLLKGADNIQSQPAQFPTLSIYVVKDAQEFMVEKCFKNKQELINTLNEIWLDKFKEDVEK